MKSEYDFSQAKKSKFYHPNAKFHCSIYLEPDVEQFITFIIITNDKIIQYLYL